MLIEKSDNDGFCFMISYATSCTPIRAPADSREPEILQTAGREKKRIARLISEDLLLFFTLPLFIDVKALRAFS